MRKTCFLLIVLSLFFLASSSQGSCTAQLEFVRKKLSRIVNGPAFYGARSGLIVRVLDTGTTIYERNADLPLAPASNMKLLTSAVAFCKMGPDYRFETSLLSIAPDGTGALRGNLYLRGGGDPSICDPFVRNPAVFLETLAAELAGRGIREVTGDLVADDSLFDRRFLGKGWKASYEGEYYSAEHSALSLAGNQLRITVSPGAHHSAPGEITTAPEATFPKIVNKTKTTNRNSLRVSRKKNDNLIIVSGGISRWGGPVAFEVNVHNPPLFVASAFHEALKKKGIRIWGDVRAIGPGESVRGLTKLCSYVSPPLVRLLAHLNKESDNLFAEHFLKALAAHSQKEGSAEKADLVIRQFLAGEKISSDGLVVADGSGLSPLNRVTPRLLADLLTVMRRRDDWETFRNTLSVAGKDGTLKYRLRWVTLWGKTGAIEGVTSLSGYVVTAYGQTLAFSMITNGENISVGGVRAQEDRVIRTLAGCVEEF